MLYWSLTFLIVAAVAALLGFGGIAVGLLASPRCYACCLPRCSSSACSATN